MLFIYIYASENDLTYTVNQCQICKSFGIMYQVSFFASVNTFDQEVLDPV